VNDNAARRPRQDALVAAARRRPPRCRGGVFTPRSSRIETVDIHLSTVAAKDGCRKRRSPPRFEDSGDVASRTLDRLIFTALEDFDTRRASGGRKISTSSGSSWAQRCEFAQGHTVPSGRAPEASRRRSARARSRSDGRAPARVEHGFVGQIRHAIEPGDGGTSAGRPGRRRPKTPRPEEDVVDLDSARTREARGSAMTRTPEAGEALDRHVGAMAAIKRAGSRTAR